MSIHAYPDALNRMIAALAQFPGIGKRTAERLALAMLEWPEERLQNLAQLTATLKDRVRFCPICGNFAENDCCALCTNPNRHPDAICVVESPSQIAAIDRTGCYRGLYHVLGGRLAPLEGRGPESLSIDALRRRLQNHTVKEIILAIGSDVEGEATAAYIAAELADFPVAITRIASGIPVGADLSFADPATMAIALNARRPLR